MRKLLGQGCFSCRCFQTILELCWTWCSLKSKIDQASALETLRQSIPHLWCHVCTCATDLLPACRLGSLCLHAVIPQNFLVARTKSYQYRTCCKYLQKCLKMHKIQHTNSARWLLLKRLAKPKSSIFNLAQSCRAGFTRNSSDLDMGVNPNIGVFAPQIMNANRGLGISIINHPFWGVSPYFWKHPYANHQDLSLRR